VLVLATVVLVVDAVGAVEVVVGAVVIVIGASTLTKLATSASTCNSMAAASPIVAQPPLPSACPKVAANAASALARQAE